MTDTTHTEAMRERLCRPDQLRLHLGEMTMQELRTAQAAVRYTIAALTEQTWRANSADALDAARYRWLRAQPNDTSPPRIDVTRWTCNGDDSVNEGEGLRMIALDAAIDAALAVQSKGASHE